MKTLTLMAAILAALAAQASAAPSCQSDLNGGDIASLKSLGKSVDKLSDDEGEAMCRARLFFHKAKANKLDDVTSDDVPGEAENPFLTSEEKKITLKAGSRIIARELQNRSSAQA